MFFDIAESKEGRRRRPIRKPGTQPGISIFAAPLFNDGAYGAP